MVRVGGLDRQNLYALYNNNKESAFFWVKRFSWENTIGYVISIGDKTQGSLESFGSPPYYKNPKVKIIYFSSDGKFKDKGMQNGAGAFSWAPVEEPEWWNDERAKQLFLPHSDV